MALSFYVSSVYAAAGINQTINFQGKLVDDEGLNVANGNYDVIFKLYDASSGGTELWTETWNSGTSQVNVQDGVFRVALGTHSSMASVNFNQDTIYLSVKVGADAEMTPRIRFTSVPYAFVAKTTVDDALDFAQFEDTLDLDASTSITADGAEYLSIVNTGTGYSLLVEDQLTDTTPFVIDAAGNVGIGTTAPAANLEVVGNAQITGGELYITRNAQAFNSSNETITSLSTGFLDFLARGNISFYIDTNANGNNSFDVFANGSGTKVFTILDTGSVGIGITNPTGILQVVGDEVRIGDAGTINSATGDGDLFVEDALEVDTLAGTGTRVVYSDTNGLLTNTAPTSGTIGYWQRNGTTLAPATLTDYVGIGTTTADDELDVVGEIDTSTYYKLGNSKILDVENAQSLIVGQNNAVSMPAGADYNTIIGTNAGYSINSASADQNTIVGNYAAYSLTSGNENIAIGSGAGYDITTGGGNIFIGYYAGDSSTITGSSNVVIGYGAGNGLTSGVNNLLLGYGSSVENGTENNSIVISSEGSEATASNQFVVGGNYNDSQITDAYFGSGVTDSTPYDITFNATGGSGTDIAGANFILAGGKGTGAGDGGDLIFKTADTLTTGTTLQSLTEKMRITDDGLVGIGTTNPTSKLLVNVGNADGIDVHSSGSPFIKMTSDNVAGNARNWALATEYNGDLFEILRSTTGGGAPTTATLAINQDGNLSVGTISPTARLHSYISNAAVTTSQYTGRFENLATNTTTDAVNKYGAYITSTGAFTGSAGTATNNWGLYIDTVSGADNNYGAYIAGSVGIGTTSPVGKLEVFNNVNNSHFMHINNPNASAQASSSIAFSAGSTIGEVVVTNQNYNYSINYGTEANTLQLINRGAGPLIFKTAGYLANAERMRIDASGNVGIGTTNPIWTLDLYKPGDGTRIHLGSDAPGKTNTYLYTSSDTNGYFGIQHVKTAGSAYGDIVLNPDGGNVGIGTTSPNSRLDINGGTTIGVGLQSGDGGFSPGAGELTIGEARGNGSSGINTRLTLINGISSAAENGNSIDFVTGTNANPSGIKSRISGFGDAGNTKGFLSFSTFNSTAIQEHMRIDNLGNVGIGTTSPGYKLDVSGDVNITGSYRINGVVQSGSSKWTSGAGDNIYRSSGNVGIGTTNPSEQLEVSQSILIKGGLASGIKIDGSLIQRQTAGNALRFGVADAEVMRIQNGNVGIGTTSPTVAKLQVVGDSTTNKSITSFGQGNGGNYDATISSGFVAGFSAQPFVNVTGNSSNVFGTYYFAGANVGTGVTLTNIYGGYVDSLSKTGSGTITNAYGLYVTAPTVGINNVTAYFGGNVGIGTTSPSGKLEVVGDAAVNSRSITASVAPGATGRSGSFVLKSTLDSIFGPFDAARLSFYGNQTWQSAADYLGFDIATGNDTWATKMALLGNGNVGIGTTSPAANLSVSTTSLPIGTISLGSSLNGKGILFQADAEPINAKTGIFTRFSSSPQGINAGMVMGRYGSAWGTYVAFHTHQDNSANIDEFAERMRIDGAGNVGIGTTSPGSKFTVTNDIATGYIDTNTLTSGQWARISNPNTTSGVAATLLFEATGSGGGNGLGTISGVNTGSGSLALTFGTRDNMSNVIERVRIAANGNVGIGTTSPGYKLDVSGDVNITGSYRINGVAQSGSSKWTSGTGDNIYRSTGNVGIGTTSPQNNLDVRGSVNNFSASLARDINLNEWTGLHFGYSEAANNLYRKSAIVFERKDGAARGSIHILNDSVADNGSANLADSKLTIDLNGNVGIGTTSPGTIFNVGGTTNKSISVDSSSNRAYYGAYNDAAVLGVNRDPATGSFFSTSKAASYIAMSGGASNGYIDFFATNVNNSNPPVIMRVAGNGNVGIGSTSSSGTLSVLGGEGTYSAPNFGPTNLGAINIRNFTSDTRNAITFSAAASNNAQAGIYVHQDNSLGTHMFFATTDDYGIGPQARLTIRNNGNVGVGTTSPTLAKLDVNQNSGISPGSAIKFGAQGFLVSPSTIISHNGYWTGSAWANVSNATSALLSLQGDIAFRTAVATAGTPTWEDRLTILNSNGNVGIGTTAPGNTLTIGQNTASNNTDYSLSVLRHGTLAAPGTYTANTPAIAVIDISGDGPATAETQALLNVNAARIADTDTYAANAMLFNVQNDTGSAFTIKGNRNVGIGTTSPGARLELRASAAVGDLFKIRNSSGVEIITIDNSNGTASPKLDLNTGSGTIVRLNTSGNSYLAGGNVGIGTTSPGSQLTIVSPYTTANGSANPIFSISGNNNSNSSFVGGAQISPTIGTLGAPNLTLTAVEISPTFFANSSTTISNAYSLRISTTKSGQQFITNAYSLYVDAPTGATNNYAAYFGGNVGIGTTSPGATLDVTGGIRASSYLAAGTNSAQTGYIRIPYNQFITSRNGDNSADVNIIRISTGNKVQLGTGLDMGNQSITGVYSIEQYTSSNWSLSNAGDLNLAGSLLMDSSYILNTGGRLVMHDTRAVNDAPTAFNQEVEIDFKSRATIGAPGSTGAYGGLLTIAPWVDDSGDAHHQLFFHEDGISYRQGQPDSASWGTWYGGIFSGSVGINVSAPAEELDVEGQIQLDLDGTNDTTIGVCKDVADGASVENDVEFRDCSTTPGDIAESYRAQSDLRPGDVVALKTIDGMPTVVKADEQSLKELFGVVSTFPVGQFGAPLSHDSYAPEDLPTAIGLTGKVPVVVSLENGPIKTGDPLTVSSIAGIAKKAIKPGKIIGYAIESYDGSFRASAEVKKQEQNRSEAITKFNLDPIDPQAPYGKILMMADLGYYDPTTGLEMVGDVSVQKTASGYKTYSSSLNAVVEHLVTGAKGMFGISEMGFAKIDSAEIESAAISNLNVTNLSIGSNTINSEFISKMSGIDTMFDYSPTSGISFLAPVTTTELVAGKITTSQLEVQGITFAQKVDVQTVETQLSSIDARVDGLEARMDGVEYEIAQLREKVASMSAQLDGINSQFASWQETVGTGSAVLGASESATLADNIATLSGLMIDGKTTTFDLDVLGNINAGLLEIGGTSGTEINSLGTVVSIQALAQGGIEFVGGKVTIDTDGNLKTMAAISADTTEAREIVARKTGETAPTVGEGTILAGQTQVVIVNTNVASNSKIFVTATTSTGGQSLIVKTKTNGSFTVAIDIIHGTNIKFDYWILGVK